MTAWIDAFEGRAGADLDFPDGGFSFGDWLDTAAPPDNPAAARTAVAVRRHRLPRPLGAHRRRRRPRCSAATAAGSPTWPSGPPSRFRAEYVTPNGRVAFPPQTAYALALEFDLLTAGAARARRPRCWPSRSRRTASTSPPASSARRWSPTR